jgi:sugar phosphate isomerase/epimerase
MISRRQFSVAAAGALAASRLFAKPVKPDSVIDGVQIGAQSYSFRDRPLDAAIAAMVQIGLSECELWDGHIEPKLRGADMMHWRETAPVETFQQVRRKFDDAGIQIYALNYSFRKNWTDRAIEHGFEIARALGTDKITASTTLPVVDRIDQYAKQYKVYVGMHGHSNMKPGEFASPDSFAEAMNGRSKYICVNLDIGHFTAAGFDAVDYIQQHHDRIITLHIKDRKKNQGENMPLGQGDTPIKPVLQLLKKTQWKIPANIEYEYKGGDTVEEVTKCYAYCREALLGAPANQDTPLVGVK